MKKNFKKQVLIGIAGVLVSMGIFTLVIGFINLSYITRWLFYTILAVTVSAFFGFLLYIFGGKESFIFGAILGLGFVTFTVSVHELPQLFSGILIVILAIIFLAWPKIKEYYIENKEPSEFKASIRFGEKSMLLFATMGGIYQVINGKDTFYFVRVGGELTGIEYELLKKDFSDESGFMTNKKDFSIAKKDITVVSINQKHSANCPFLQSVKVRISTSSGRKNFFGSFRKYCGYYRGML